MNILRYIQRKRDFLIYSVEMVYRRGNQPQSTQRTQSVDAFLCVLCALCGFLNQMIIISLKITGLWDSAKEKHTL
jgi:hypothetical protein